MAGADISTRSVQLCRVPRDDLEPTAPDHRDLEARIADARRLLGERIADLRAPLKISQEALADRTGLSRRTVQRIESGEGDARYSNLMRIAAALHEDVAVLVTPPADDPACPPRG